MYFSHRSSPRIFYLIENIYFEPKLLMNTFCWLFFIWLPSSKCVKWAAPFVLEKLDFLCMFLYSLSLVCLCIHAFFLPKSLPALAARARWTRNWSSRGHKAWAEEGLSSSVLQQHWSNDRKWALFFPPTEISWVFKCIRGNFHSRWISEISAYKIFCMSGFVVMSRYLNIQWLGKFCTNRLWKQKRAMSIASAICC